MQSAPGQGLALGGIGVATATYVAPQLGLTLPRLALVVLLAAAIVMTLGGFFLEVVARRGASDAKTTSIELRSAHTGAGSVSGNIIHNSTVQVGAPADLNERPESQFRRAVADVEIELERTLGQIEDAVESGLYRRRFPTQASRRYQTLSGLLADRNLPDERQRLAQTYRRLERLSSRMRERKWSGSSMPEMTIPDVRSEDQLGETTKMVAEMVSTLKRLPGRTDDDAPSRPQNWRELSQRYATWNELAESKKSWSEVADTRVPLHVDVGDEIVAMIDEIRTNAFAETSYATYIDWVERNSAFIETVLGAVERERFCGQARAPTTTAVVDLHIERLRDLLDRLPSLPLRVEAGRLRQAIQQRRESSRPTFVTMRQ